MKRFNLALKLLWRDSRSGELTLLVLALLIAVSSSTSISLFADRLQRTMNLQAAEFLAADLVVTAAAPISADWLAQARTLALAQAQTTEFTSVLLENNQTLLASVKAVSSSYPLRGHLKTENNDDSDPGIHSQGPQPGSAWVEKRVLSALNIKLGDTLTVGEKPLTVSRVLSYEPDKRGDFYSFSPRVMIHLDDLQATGVIQPGSRARYFFQFSGAESALTEFKNWLKPQLNPSQRIMDIHEDRPELGSALSRAERYLGLSGIVVILIAGAAIAMAARRYTERHFNATALLRCLGCQQQEILWLYTCQFIVLGLLASGSGCLLGWLGQQGLFYLLRDLMPQQLAAPSWLAVVFGLITGMTILMGFALPPLLRLKKVSALRVLRQELEPLPTSGWLIYGLALGTLAVLIWRYTADLRMTVTVLGAGALSLALLGLLIFALLRLVSKLLPRMSLSWRFALQGIIRNSQASVSQILAFSITLTAMVLSFSVRGELLDSWRQQLPQQAPNHFAINILADRQQAFADDLHQAQVRSSRFFPVVRGRLVAINGDAVQQRVSKDTQGEAATQRELSLTWGETLPEDNQITAGAPWQADQSGLVSVEQKLAENLNIQVGDKLTFTVGSEQLLATVANIRSLQWDTMKPNFYMIFSPGNLESFPTTYMTSFYLAPEQKNLLNDLIKKYPATTILEVDQILKQLKTILTQLTMAIDYLLYFALLAGFTVLFAAVYTTLDSRIYQGALMRTLGAQRSFLRQTQLIEFSLLGALAGTLAAIISQAVLYGLYSQVMHIDYHPDLLVIAGLPLLGAICVGLAGYWGVREVVNQSPMRVLRRL